MGRPLALIRGYLPVRVCLPDDHGDTFVFVKSHAGGGGGPAKGGRGGSSSSTLFVANAPAVPGVRTRLFLRALFERFGDVERVTVVRNPRSGGGAPDAAASSIAEGRLFAERSGVGASSPNEDPNDEGKFAHVEFASPKQIQRALKALKGAMAKRGDDGAPPTVTFGALEVRELRDRTDRALRSDARRKRDGVDDRDHDGDDDNSDSDNDAEDAGPPDEQPTGLDALVQRHKSKFLPRAKLLEECNAVVGNYEEAEEEAERRARAGRDGPDEDGFITVSHGPSVRQDLEEEDPPAGDGGGGGAGAIVGGRKTSKRSRGKKKGVGGAAELQDFYRFQMKESRKRSLHELRKRFEEDLEKVKKMKEEKKYRPF